MTERAIRLCLDIYVLAADLLGTIKGRKVRRPTERPSS